MTKPILTDEERDSILRKYKLYNVKTLKEGIGLDSLREIGNFEDNEEEMLQKYLNNVSNSNIAELSLISFLKTIGRIIMDKEVNIYNKNKKLLKYLPNFKVHLGFGLHAGWSIEGAIGSHFKIDMSYLSPNVNMSSRLEGLTKTYKKPLLFTGSLYNLFTTPKLKKMCRKLDRVVAKGSNEAFDLYTIEVDLPRLEQKASKVE